MPHTAERRLFLKYLGPGRPFPENDEIVRRYWPTSGQNAGLAFQFVSAPVESELTGPSWAPDERTLFLAVQHPGEVNGRRRAGESRGSNWPHRQHGAPLPAVVVIRHD